MASWPIQDARTHFDDLLAASTSEGPQTITKEGVETAVVVPIAEWRRINGAAANGPKKYANLKEWLLAPEPKFDLDEMLQGDRPQVVPRPVELD